MKNLKYAKQEVVQYCSWDDCISDWCGLLVCSPFCSNSTTTAIYIGICVLALDDL